MGWRTGVVGRPVHGERANARRVGRRMASGPAWGERAGALQVARSEAAGRPAIRRAGQRCASGPALRQAGWRWAGETARPARHWASTAEGPVWQAVLRDLAYRPVILASVTRANTWRACKSSCQPINFAIFSQFQLCSTT
jgi:hypothetical protein